MDRRIYIYIRLFVCLFVCLLIAHHRREQPTAPPILGMYVGFRGNISLDENILRYSIHGAGIRISSKTHIHPSMPVTAICEMNAHMFNVVVFKNATDRMRECGLGE